MRDPMPSSKDEQHRAIAKHAVKLSKKYATKSEHRETNGLVRKRYPEYCDDEEAEEEAGTSEGPEGEAEEGSGSKAVAKGKAARARMGRF
jgi:hypothetical protein